MTIKQRLTHQLLADYHKWACDETEILTHSEQGSVLSPGSQAV